MNLRYKLFEIFTIFDFWLDEMLYKIPSIFDPVPEIRKNEKLKNWIKRVNFRHARRYVRRNFDMAAKTLSYLELLDPEDIPFKKRNKFIRQRERVRAECRDFSINWETLKEIEAQRANTL